MHLMSKCQRVADVCKISHNIGNVLEILMLRFKTCSPVVDEWAIPECIYMHMHLYYSVQNFLNNLLLNKSWHVND